MTLSTAILPQLWDAIRHHYEAGSWSSVMLDAINALGDELRSKSGLHSDGTTLVGQALGGKAPKVKLNRLITETEQNVQTGTENVVRGLYQAIRNPRSHGRIDDTEADATAIVLMVNYLLVQLGQAKAAFSTESFLESLHDKNFVPSQRYAALLLADVPKNKLADTVNVAFLQRPANSQPLREFFTSAIALLEPDDRKSFFDAVTAQLKSAQVDSDLRTILQAMRPEFWPEIGEVARLRAEHWIAKNIEEGQYDRRTRKFYGGTLATWAREYLTKFTLRREVANAIIACALSSEERRKSYAFHHFIQNLDGLMDSPPPRFVTGVKQQLTDGDEETFEAIRSLLGWHDDDSWNKAFDIAIAEFKARPQAPDDFADDDIPF